MQTLARTKNTPTQPFVRPSLPTAACMHFIRHFQPVTRGELVQHTGKSQPTVTRAVAALIEADLVRERTDLAIPLGPGRPKVPLALAPSPFTQVGVAIGTHTTYVGAYSIRGNALQEQLVHTTAAKQTPEQFVATIADAVRHVASNSNLPLAAIGVSTSGSINRYGHVNAANLGWRNVQLAELFAQHFEQPLTISSAIQAIAGAELQSQAPDNPRSVLVLHSDDSIGAALSDGQEVRTLDVADRASLLDASIQLLHSYSPSTIVLAGDTFDSTAEAKLFYQSLRGENDGVEIRIFPAHLENARAAARAVAMERLIANPLAFAPGS